MDRATGRFSIVLPQLPADAGPLDLFVDAAPGTARRYHPSLDRTTSASLPSVISVLLVPTTMTLDSGTYAGRTVPISVVKAFTPVCPGANNGDCSSFWPSIFLSAVRVWPDAAKRTPLAIDRTNASIAIGSADSIALWAAIRQMETDEAGVERSTALSGTGSWPGR